MTPPPGGSSVDLVAIVEALQGIQAAAETANEQVAGVIADHNGEGRVRVDSYNA